MHALDVILPAIASIKNPAFSEEREWRLLKTIWRGEVALHFRPGSIGIIPYQVFKYPVRAIVSVVIGPGHYPTQRVEAIRQLLRYHDMPNVEVVTSSSPLRL